MRAVTFLRSRRLYLGGLGLVYLAAFASYGVQVLGLIGSDGILPAAAAFSSANAAREGLATVLSYPTLFWLGCSDSALRATCVAGGLLSALLIAGIAPRAVLVALWSLYLSLTVAGQVFLSFQWDNLLLEAGLLALFVAPRGLLPRQRWRESPSALGLFLQRFLLFRLLFFSGLTKLTWGDPNWLQLRALDVYYWTQPLPQSTSAWLHDAPTWVQRASCLSMFAIELVLPWLFFGPRRLRLLAAAGTVLLQLGIAASGNYGFFNLLTVVLCLPLVDDRALRALVPTALRRFLRECEPMPRRRSWRTWLAGAAAVAFGALAAVVSIPNIAPGVVLPSALADVAAGAGATRSIGSYGLFRTMTTRRFELVVEGSDDGTDWREYEFRYRPGDVGRSPPIAGLHLPRLDWQMWFEALRLGRSGPSNWFGAFLARLLEGSHPVRGLLARVPFSRRPPAFVRVVAYEYRFATADQRSRGVWWERERLGLYTPALVLRDGELVRAW